MVDDFKPRRRLGIHDNAPQRQRPVQFQAPQASATDQGQGNQPATQQRTPPFMGNTALHGAAKPPKKSFKEKLASLSKKQWVLIAAAAVVLFGGAGVAAYILLNKAQPEQQVVTPVKTGAKPAVPVDTRVPSKLTGLLVEPSFNERQVTAVMIENSTDARPQSGLNDAGVVFEAVAEGGITRFTALFQDTEPEYVGPVRSVRPYYIQWIRGFDAAVAHVGGSGEALAMLKRGEAKDLDQFTNAKAFWRVSNRFAPHNMYTSIPKLRELQASRGYAKSDYTAIPRNTKENPAKVPTARSIDFTLSSPLYNSHYDYDAATNTYKRSEGGQPHMDEKSGAQLAPKVVVGLVMPQGRNGIYTTYQTIGSGAAYIFQDGTMVQGSWHKSANASNFTFTDANGAPLKLNPGQTWFSVVGGVERVKYAP